MKATITLPVDDADAAFALHVFAAILNREHDMETQDLGFFGKDVPNAMSHLILLLSAGTWNGYKMVQGDMWDSNNGTYHWDEALLYLKEVIREIEKLRPTEATTE